ncbi:MarR family winged helix-turn-helix transcriptional regulator [Anaerosinus massiliensis]|uniref:MarR family winged helix-turn-helix transcriptional regulator n=1 Tax=Massilibacillus massiliensis TaxID=1806837 RepID=UPI000A49B359|nr:MarR family transcriptional regulator [Massilibacillus massiliensis]
MQSICDIKFRELNLQRGQFIFLTRICEQPGIHLNELSNLLKVDKATTTKAVQKLMAEDYVRKTRDCEDKRIYHLFPSEKAKKIYPYMIEEENLNIESCFQDFSVEEKKMMEQFMKRMCIHIDQYWKETKSSKEQSIQIDKKIAHKMERE